MPRPHNIQTILHRILFLYFIILLEYLHGLHLESEIFLRVQWRIQIALWATDLSARCWRCPRGSSSDCWRCWHSRLDDTIAPVPSPEHIEQLKQWACLTRLSFADMHQHTLSTPYTSDSRLMVNSQLLKGNISFKKTFTNCYPQSVMLGN